MYKNAMNDATSLHRRSTYSVLFAASERSQILTNFVFCLQYFTIRSAAVQPFQRQNLTENNFAAFQNDINCRLTLCPTEILLMSVFQSM